MVGRSGPRTTPAPPAAKRLGLPRRHVSKGAIFLFNTADTWEWQVVADHPRLVRSQLVEQLLARFDRLFPDMIRRGLPFGMRERNHRMNERVTENYERFAATGEYIDNSWLIRPPLHVLMFSALLRVAIALGEPAWGQHMIRAVHLVLSLVSILIGYGLARRLFGLSYVAARH